MSKFPKSLIRSLYDLQQGRIQTGNRIVAEIKSRLGQLPGMSEEQLEAEAKNYLADARAEYKRIADAFVLNKANSYMKPKFDDYRIISDPIMLIFVEVYEEQINQEEQIAKVVAKVVEKNPLWKHFLLDVKGCGALMSAVILSEFDIHKAERISQFWAYAGLDVCSDGNGRSRKKEHLVKQTYIDKEGKEQEKDGISFNPFLKTKLVGVLGSCLMKANGKYKTIYDNYKHRLENHCKHIEKTKLHRHNMAVRYMIKIFLQDLWMAWRELEGLEITKPYHEAKLGHTHRFNN